jgi:hypothetical protein
VFARDAPWLACTLRALADVGRTVSASGLVGQKV